MEDTVRWQLKIDSITDALVRTHLANTNPPVTLGGFVEHAIAREFDRLALLEHERSTAPRPRSDDMWEIVIPLPLKRSFCR